MVNVAGTDLPAHIFAKETSLPQINSHFAGCCCRWDFAGHALVFGHSGAMKCHETKKLIEGFSTAYIHNKWRVICLAD